MDPRKHRLTLLALAIAFVALLGAAVALYPKGDPHNLPEPVLAVYPAPGQLVLAQTYLEVEMPIGYTVSFVVDGIPIPASEVIAVTAIGTFRWQPGLLSVIPAWTTGEHTVEIAWDSPSRPDPGSFTWIFNVT